MALIKGEIFICGSMRNKEAAEQRSASLVRYLRPREAGKGEKTIDIRFKQQVKVITERFASIPPL
jgi:hypothetical protein